MRMRKLIFSPNEACTSHISVYCLHERHERNLQLLVARQWNRDYRLSTFNGDCSRARARARGSARQRGELCTCDCVLSVDSVLCALCMHVYLYFFICCFFLFCSTNKRVFYRRVTRQTNSFEWNDLRGSFTRYASSRCIEKATRKFVIYGTKSRAFLYTYFII